jgi:hypothetical protein
MNEGNPLGWPSFFSLTEKKTCFYGGKNCDTIQKKKAERLLFMNLWLMIRRLL